MRPAGAHQSGAPVAGFDMGAFDKLRSPGYAQIDLGADLVRQFSQPLPRARLRLPPRDAGARRPLLAVTATSAGNLPRHRLLVRPILDAETTYCSASRSRTNHWKQAMDFFPEPVAVQPGDRLQVVAGYDNTRIFFKNSGL